MGKLSFPHCPWQPNIWNYNGGQKIKVLSLFILVAKRCVLMRGFLILSQNWNQKTFDLIFVQKRSKEAKYPILSVSDHFLAKMGSNVIWFQFWDQIRNPPIKADLLDTKMKVVKTFIFWPHCNFKSLVARGRVGIKNREMNRAYQFPEIQGTM